MNRLETWMMNNPLRAAAQRWHAGPLFERLGGRTEGLRVLEPGCGRGIGVEILLERFGAARVDAFDLDPEMVGLARRRLARYGERVSLWDGSATSIPAEDGTYDAVFTFGVLHHVPVWRDALAEVVRVLKPGGRLFAEESFANFITHPLWRRLLHHPQEDRFDAGGLRDAFARHGLRVTGSELGLGESLGWFVAVRE